MPTINEGTQTIIHTVTNAGTQIQVVKLDAGVGTAVLNWGGTIPTVANLTNGTVRISVGTITTGSLSQVAMVNAGTMQTFGQRHADEFATVVNSGTSVLGTIRAAVAGSVIYVTSCVISVNAASNVEIASGGTSTPIAGTFFFAGSAGAAVTPIDPPWRTASGSALVYKQSANTGLSLTVTGYID